MANENEDKALIASSEFDPSAFVKGIDAMTSSLETLSAQEDVLQKQLTAQNKQLADNKNALKATNDQLTALSKTSSTYQTDQAKLAQQQETLLQQQGQLQKNLAGTKDQLGQVTTQANTYKEAIGNITTVAKQLGSQGKTLFDVGALQQRVQSITALASQFKDIFKGKIDTSELDALEDKLAANGDEFKRLEDVIGFVKDKLGTLDSNTQEFKDLADVVKTGEQVLQDYAKVQDTVGNRSSTVSKRLREVRQELAALQEAGETGTEQFAALSKEAAELQDAMDKTGERIKVLASDTRLIEGGIELLRGFAAGFELVEGAEALLGVKNEAVEESIKRLNAIMAIANGLQEVSNLLKKESTIRIVAEEIATKAYTISQRILAVTLGSTAAASKGLATALAATGIGAIVVAIGVVIALLSQWTDATKEQAEEQERLNAANEIGIDFLNRFIGAIGNSNKLLQAETELRQALNEKASASDVQRLRTRIANAQALRAIDEKTLREQIEQAKQEEESQAEEADRAATRIKDIVAQGKNNQAELLPILQKTVDDFTKVQETRFALENALEIKQLNNQRDAARDRIELRKQELSQAEDFLKRLEELRKRLLDAQNKQSRQDEAQLAKTAQDNLNFELKNIEREIRQGKLTRDQGNLLKNLLKQINGVELETELREFRRKSVAAQQSIEDAIFNLRVENGTQRANLLRDQLEREAALIEVTARDERNKLEEQRTQALEGVADAFRQGFISEGQAKTNADRIQAIYAQMFLNLEEQTRRKQEELANLAFQRSQALVQQLFAASATNVTEKSTEEIVKLAQRFTSGKINYERYQKELTAIAQRESQKRIAQQLAEDMELLAGVQRRLAVEKDPARRDELQAEILRLREEIAQLRRQAAQGEVDQSKSVDDDFKKKLDRVAAYAQAIGSLVASVVSFWQTANEAESKALDRSITLQQKRVDAAVRIAERGNAEYLRLEEDRLHELQVKQENNARRQLAINAVLQGSQALVAFTSALAQGIATGGPLGGIAIAAAVLGLLAQGYAIVQSLQASSNGSQQLFQGTTNVRRRNGEPAGVDTVPAMLTEGEAVIPAHTNRDYAPAVAAIYDRAIPAAALNDFVANYRGASTSGTLAQERMAEAGDVAVTYDARLVQAAQDTTRQMQETNDNIQAMHKTLKGIGINVSLDKKGLAIALMGVINKQNITKKS